jgi:hypothetical protein
VISYIFYFATEPKNNTYQPTTSKTSAYTEEERQAFLQKNEKVKETQLFDENCKGSF